MNENWREARKLLNLVTSTIDCILHNRYDAYTRKPFYVELGTEVGPGASHTAEEIEKMLDMLLHKPELDRPETAAAFSALKEEHTHERLAAFLKQFVNIPLEAELALLELKEKSWEEILIWIDSYIYQRPYLEREMGKLVVEQREGFSSPGAREIERAFDTSPGELLSLYVVRKYARELKETFPQMVERAQLLRLIPTSKNVPNHVRRYLEEASRCHVYGNFLASLLLCRAAIEAAAKDRLRAKGFAQDLIGLATLEEVLRLALDKNVMDDARWQASEHVRKMANKAVHSGGVPDEHNCMHAYDVTRDILQRLYE